MKIVLIVFFCLFINLYSFGQTESQVGVSEITLFRDDGKGKAGEEASSFSTTDKPIHLSVELDSTEPAAIKMNMVAVSVPGLKTEKTVVSVSYKTDGNQDVVNFNASPRTVWIAGKYRIDVFVDGKLGARREFEIKEAAPPKEEETKSFPPKPAKQKRKN